ncbi:hypothetical protein [Dietzia natronolimnaea]|uniref:hypothetical protein n=1 Tax=Dietzia natronolimnaea TaxID=161920 RepID=UPI0015FA1637|nr:hypothetical protein [Dietzia natronolimnaea]MBB1038647.1 hypothetical protein [Dietzia natronolimnaea]
MEEDLESINGSDGYKPVIRFFPDYGRQHPLWDSGTDKYGMDPEDYGLSESLARRLAEWMRHWESNVIPETGWKTAEAAAESTRVGDALVADLRIEVSGFAEVRDERKRANSSVDSDHTISVFVSGAVFVDGSLPPLKVGDVINASLLFDTDVSHSTAGVDSFRVTVRPECRKAPVLDRESSLQWPFHVAGDGWTARWLHHEPFAGRVQLVGRLSADSVRALPGHPDTTSGRVRRLRLVEERYESTESGRHRVPGTERVSELDHESDHYWPNWRILPVNEPFHPTGMLVDLDLDDVPVAHYSFDAGAIAVSGSDVWVMDRSNPVLIHIDTAPRPPRVTEYLLPLAIEPPTTMWTRRVHADRDGCWITVGDEVVRCSRDGPAELTLQRVSTDGGDDTVELDSRLFVLTYPGLATQLSDRYGALRGAGPDSFHVREVVGDELIPVTDEPTIARTRARASDERANIATTPEGTTWTAAGRVTVEPAVGTSSTIDLHPRSQGRVRWIRPDVRSGLRVDEISNGSSDPPTGKLPSAKSER